MSKEYSELLKDERWIAKRRAIMARDNHTCRECHTTERRLNVHHKYYDPDTMPWEYPSNSLITLCDNCHADWEVMRKMSRDFYKPLLSNGWQPEEIIDLVDLLTYYEPDQVFKMLKNNYS